MISSIDRIADAVERIAFALEAAGKPDQAPEPDREHRASMPDDWPEPRAAPPDDDPVQAAKRELIADVMARWEKYPAGKLQLWPADDPWAMEVINAAVAWSKVGIPGTTEGRRLISAVARYIATKPSDPGPNS